MYALPMLMAIAATRQRENLAEAERQRRARQDRAARPPRRERSDVLADLWRRRRARAGGILQKGGEA